MRRPLLAVGIAGLLQEALWLGLYRISPLRTHTEPFLAIHVGLFAACAASFVLIGIPDRRTARLVLAFALLFRLTVLPAPPDQSEDVYRYIWDARVSAAGSSPFAHPPSAPQLSHLRDATVYPMLNSKPHVTAYPPLSQLLFRGVFAAFGPNVVAMKGVFGLLEFAFLLLAWKMLQDRGKGLRPLYLVAWNPFFIFEFWHSGHSDSAALFLALLTFYLLSRNRSQGAMLSWVGAVTSKLHPALWYPLLLRRVRWPAHLAAAGAAAALVLCYFTPELALRYLDSLRAYYRLFEFNASIHYLLRFVGRAGFDADWDQATGPYLLAVLLCVSGAIWWKSRLRHDRDLLHAVFWLMTADLCLSTTVHPWYLSWAAFALPFFPYAFMFYWTGASALSYMAYAYRPVYEPGWVLLVEYIPVYALMTWEISRGRPLLWDFPPQPSLHPPGHPGSPRTPAPTVFCPGR